MLRPKSVGWHHQGSRDVSETALAVPVPSSLHPEPAPCAASAVNARKIVCATAPQTRECQVCGENRLLLRVGLESDWRIRKSVCSHEYCQSCLEAWLTTSMDTMRARPACPGVRLFHRPETSGLFSVVSLGTTKPGQPADLTLKCLGLSLVLELQLSHAH